MIDVICRIVKALSDGHPEGTVFVLERLTGIREGLRDIRKGQRAMLSSWAYAELRKRLESRTAMKGQRVIYVDPMYTSQTCPKCGHVERANRVRKEHRFECRNEECGHRDNDDRVGARNIRGRGLEAVVRCGARMTPGTTVRNGSDGCASGASTGAHASRTSVRGAQSIAP